MDYLSLRDKSSLPVFQDLDLAGEAVGSAPVPGTSDGTGPLSGAPLFEALRSLRGRHADLSGAKARSGPAGSPLVLPGQQKYRDGGSGRGRPPGSPDKDAPWSADHLLADATHMNDEYVSLQANPLNDHLYAVFAATDLGGTDRDIHIARSLDDGATWQVWEMPSFSQDEYQPELAIDGAGYLYVTWIRDDGVIVRSRSQYADDPASWAWVRGLNVGEPCATPCIAVSGAGQYSTVFIAAGWLTVNWDLYQYEWTLVWMYSTNGGDTVLYDYLMPDGYQDFWPDVALHGGTAYLINGEEDYYSGEMEILLAADAVSGGFGDVSWLSDWTSFNCGFPSLAADGSDVYCVYQLDFDDGLGNIDGDVIYFFSWDGCQSIYGPYEIVADEYESVGPTIFTRDGVVGCLWLDAPPNADEFDLASRQAALDGHPDAWGSIEIVTDQHYVEPSFRSAAGAVASASLHAAWIDRRDYPTAGLNVYTSERPSQANLTVYTPQGWEAPLVASMVPGERQNGPLAAGQPAYVSFAVVNLGLRDATRDFDIALALDGTTVAVWVVEGGLPTGTYVAVEDYSIVAGEGVHELSFQIDTGNDIVESDETDNSFTSEHDFVTGDPELRITPEMVMHAFPAPAPGKRALDDLATTPPLRREAHLPVIGSRLEQALRGAGPAEQLRVVIVPAVRVDVPALTAACRSLQKTDQRTLVAAALRGHIEEVQRQLGGVTSDLVSRGEMSPPEALWMPGVLSARMTPAAVRTLAAQPKVGWLWLDDRLSEPFGGPGAATADGNSQAAQPADATRPRGDAAAGEKALAWHVTRIGAEQAWQQGYDGSGVIVGHTDSGAAYDHPDLAGQLWDGGPAYPHHGWDFLDEDNDPYDGDTEIWHGTHTAGLIVGDGTGGTTTGAAPGARLMITRCVPGYFDDMTEALQFCLDHGAQVISTSAGWSDPDAGLREANRYNAEVLLAAGIPWVCAAGNGDNMGGHYPLPRDIASPGDCPHPSYGNGGHTAVITVGSSTLAEQISSDSGHGPTAWAIAGQDGYDDYPYPPGLIKPDLAAPGANITSTYGGGGYVIYSGTSMAAPLVAGACAILLQASPGLLPEDLAAVLEVSAVDLGPSGRDNAAGAGRLDVPAALSGLPSSGTEFFWVHNDGPLPLVVSQVSWAADWLSVNPASATVTAQDSVRFTARFDPTGYGIGSYRDEIRLASNDPASPHALIAKMVIGDVIAVDEPAGQGPPAGAARLGNYPNPFNPRTILHFETWREGRVVLQIYDVRGCLVSQLVDGVLPAGLHKVVWEGEDAGGRLVASGAYLARLQGPSGLRAEHRVMLIR